ncbi:MAG TPA: FAD-dependent oxidoreductase, partial [Lachnospiraceae bacterium]|nr:FAD-dependent oxidoreductase [Lachnospiraceae bacterium]
YLFEGGMHWLTGSSSKTSFYKLWCEVGALNDEVRIWNRDPFFIFEHDGHTVCLYRDIEKLQAHFLETAPEDGKEIRKFCRDIKKFMRVQMPVTDIKGVKTKNKANMSFSEGVRMLPALLRMGFYAKQTAGEYAGRFKNPVLRMLLQNITGPDSCATGLLFTIATLASGDGGYPEGGSLAMAARMAAYFKSLGGKLEFGKTVSKVIVEKGAACGVIVNGEQIPADDVIVTQDARRAIDTLFDSPINEAWAVRMRQETVPMLDTFICLGIEADLSDLPESLLFTTKEPLVCGGIAETTVSFNNYATYQGYAPEGCTAVTSIIGGDTYDFWKACRENGTYEEEKKKLADAYIRILTKRIPQIAGKIAVWNIATPLTYERYLGSFKGSWMTVMKKGSANKGYPLKPERISHLYFAGHRMMPPGGLPVAVETGRKAVQYLCRDTDTVFQGNF